MNKYEQMRRARNSLSCYMVVAMHDGEIYPSGDPVRCFRDAADHYAEVRDREQAASVYRLDPFKVGENPTMVDVTDDAIALLVEVHDYETPMPDWMPGADHYNEELAASVAADHDHIRIERAMIHV